MDSPHQVASRKKRKIITGVIVVLAVIAVAWIVYQKIHTRPPLTEQQRQAVIFSSITAGGPTTPPDVPTDTGVFNAISANGSSKTPKTKASPVANQAILNSISAH